MTIPTYKARSKRMNERNKRGLCIHWVRTIDPCERCDAGDQEEIIEDPDEPQWRKEMKTLITISVTVMDENDDTQVLREDDIGIDNYTTEHENMINNDLNLLVSSLESKKTRAEKE